METGLTHDTSPAICPTCSAPVAAGARFCSRCGTPIQLAAPPAQAMPTYQDVERLPQSPSPLPSASPFPSPAQNVPYAPYAPDPAPIPPPSATMDASAGAMPTAAEGMRQCAWCGAVSAAHLDRCAACGAVFPRPEMDAAIEQAAEQWMRTALGDLEARREKRLRKGLGRLFG